MFVLRKLGMALNSTNAGEKGAIEKQKTRWGTI